MPHQKHTNSPLFLVWRIGFPFMQQCNNFLRKFGRSEIWGREAPRGDDGGGGERDRTRREKRMEKRERKRKRGLKVTLLFLYFIVDAADEKMGVLQPAAGRNVCDFEPLKRYFSLQQRFRRALWCKTMHNFGYILAFQVIEIIELRNPPCFRSGTNKEGFLDEGGVLNPLGPGRNSPLGPGRNSPLGAIFVRAIFEAEKHIRLSR